MPRSTRPHRPKRQLEIAQARHVKRVIDATAIDVSPPTLGWPRTRHYINLESIDQMRHGGDIPQAQTERRVARNAFPDLHARRHATTSPTSNLRV